MRRVRLDKWSFIAGVTCHKLLLNSPAGGWFPALRKLTWRITASDLPYANLFFSQGLEEVSIFVPWLLGNSSAPPDVLSAVASAISSLPTSTLQSLVITLSPNEGPWPYFKDSISSLVLRCGSSLTEFTSPVPLSDAAVDHLIRLPHLRTWRIGGPPPSYSASPSPLEFPPLTKLTLGGGAVREWLSLFRHLERSVSGTQGMTPLSKVKGSLESLNIEQFPDPIVDPPFASTIQTFRNLVNLGVAVKCYVESREAQCAFKLNNNGVAELATVLSRLEHLNLGQPCSENTCSTTVACLLRISAFCVKLRKLEIHFNTTNIVDDFKNLSGDPRFQELRSLPRCPLTHLGVWKTPLTLDDPDFETVANGMVDIFPSLQSCSGAEGVWRKLNLRIAGLRAIRIFPTCHQ